MLETLKLETLFTILLIVALFVTAFLPVLIHFSWFALPF